MNPMPEMPALSAGGGNNNRAQSSALMDAYSSGVYGTSEGASLDELYKKNYVYKNTELSAKMDLVKGMTLMDDDEVLETIHSHGAGFDKHRENWIFTFLTNEYKAKYPQLTDIPAVWEWVCFVVLMLVFEGEESLTKLKNSNYTGINVENANLGRRKRLRIGTRTSSVPVRIETRIVHPFENHEYYKNHEMLFSIGRAIEYIMPSIFAPLKATHMRSTQKISIGATDERVPCIKIDVAPGFVVNFNHTVVKNLPFFNYDCPELVDYIESLVNNDLKLKYGLKIGTRKTAGREKALMANNESKKTAVLNYSVIKSISVFIESKGESCLGIRSYDDLKVTIGNNVLLTSDEFEAIIERFNVAETTRYSEELDQYNAEKARQMASMRPLAKVETTEANDEVAEAATTSEAEVQDEDAPDDSAAPADSAAAKRQRLE